MKVALLGDTALYGKFSLQEGLLKTLLQKTAEVLSSYDYVVLNLETPFAKEKAKKYGNKSAYIKSDAENIELLKFFGVDAVCLANNHIFDFGYDSFELTKKILSENDIAYFGVEGKGLKVDLLGNKISFNGYCCYSTNPINASLKGVNPLDYKSVFQALNEDKSTGYSSILSIHAGQEHVNFPNYDHIEFARKLSIVHPYIFYGHHPHVLQGVEKYNDSLMVYSLGNFCFDDVYTEKSIEPLVKMNDNNKESAILSLEFDDSKLKGYKLMPVFDGQVCEGNQRDNILQKINEYSNHLKSDKDTYNVMRSELLNTYIQGRKCRRDLNWYLKRLNYNSFKMIMNRYRNKKLYKKAIISHL